MKNKWVQWLSGGTKSKRNVAVNSLKWERLLTCQYSWNRVKLLNKEEKIDSVTTFEATVKKLDLTLKKLRKNLDRFQERIDKIIPSTVGRKEIEGKNRKGSSALAIFFSPTGQSC